MNKHYKRGWQDCRLKYIDRPWRVTREHKEIVVAIGFVIALVLITLILG